MMAAQASSFNLSNPISNLASNPASNLASTNPCCACAMCLDSLPTAHKVAVYRLGLAGCSLGLCHAVCFQVHRVLLRAS